MTKLGKHSTSCDQQAREELKVFSLFAKASGLPVRRVTSGDAGQGQPDILCEIQGVGPVAFELTELVTPTFARELQNGQQLKRLFQDAFAKDSVLNQLYHNAHIYIGFQKDAALNHRKAVIPEIVATLREKPDTFKGLVWPLPKQLRRAVRELTINRGTFSGPIFDLMEATLREHNYLKRLESKFQKNYETDRRMELLAYFAYQPAPTGFDWKSEFHRQVVQKMKRSAFKRIWVYDCWDKDVKYVHPRTRIGS